MRLQNISIPGLLRRKYFWQAALAFLSIALVIYFIRNERYELGNIKNTIAGARLLYIGIGTVLVPVYFILQGWLYRWSFYTVGKKIPLQSATMLFLKRNLVGVFVPGGTLSALAFFNKSLDKHRLNKSQQYLGSYIFAFASSVSIIVVAIPAFIMLFMRGQLNAPEIAGFIIVTIFIALLGFILFSLISETKGWGYRLLSKYKPEWVILFDEFSQQSISRKRLIEACLISVVIELVGIAHLYISMLALNATPSLFIAFAGYVAMIILLSVSPFLRGLGAIELSLTYLLLHYGYSKTIAPSVILLFRFFEFWLPLLAGVVIFIFKRESLLVRVLPAFIILFLGVTNIVSALTPAIPARLSLIQQWFPDTVTQLSNFTVLLFGLVLILLSIYLFLGVKNAWRTALVLTFISIVGHIVKAADYEEALVALVAFSSLIIARKSYVIKQDFMRRHKNGWRIMIVIAVLLVYSVAGFYFLEKVHFKQEFNFADSTRLFIKAIFVYDNRQFGAHTAFARDFLFSVRFLSASAFLYILWTLFRPFWRNKPEIPEGRALAAEIVKNSGKSSLDYFKAYSDKLFFFNRTHTGFLSYKVAENYAVVLEDPVAPTEKEASGIVQEFRESCNEKGLSVFYYRLPRESLKRYLRLGYHSVLIGQEAIVDLETFSLSGTDKKSLRNGINKVKSMGIISRVYEPPLKDGLLQKLKLVSNEWLMEHHRKEIGFTQGVFDENEIKSTTVITAETLDEKVIAFINLLPGRPGAEGTFDLMRKIHDAPGGTFDFLFFHMFEYFKENGYKYINLGLVALAGYEKGHSLRQRATFLLVEYLKNNSRFKGLYEFKEKFNPEWSDKFLAYESNTDLLRFPLVMSKVSKAGPPLV